MGTKYEYINDRFTMMLGNFLDDYIQTADLDGTEAILAMRLAKRIIDEDYIEPMIEAMGGWEALLGT